MLFRFGIQSLTQNNISSNNKSSYVFTEKMLQKRIFRVMTCDK